MNRHFHTLTVGLTILAALVGCNSATQVPEAISTEAEAAFAQTAFDSAPGSGWVEVVAGGWKKETNHTFSTHVSSREGAAWEAKYLKDQAIIALDMLKPALTEAAEQMEANVSVAKDSNVQTRATCTAKASALPYSTGSGAKAFASASCLNLSNTAGSYCAKSAMIFRSTSMSFFFKIPMNLLYVVP